MKQIIVAMYLFFTLITAFVSVAPIQAQTRHATCDACGYCPDSYPTPPTKWPACATCLYGPDFAAAGAESKKTLEIDEESNTPLQPAQGHYYSVFGCIKTDLSDFTQTGAAQSLVQLLLNAIFGISGGVAILYIIYGSYVLMTSRAEPEKLAYGKRVLIGAVIGLVFALTSVFVVNLLANNILGIPGFSPETP
ncbi:MAG: pilin [Patescibacteria group bacterium]